MMEPIPFATPLKIDTRPLWKIVVNRTVRYQILAFMLMASIFIYRLTPPVGLSVAGYHSLLIFGNVIVFWVLELLPLPVTSLFAMALLSICQIIPSRQIYALFGNEALFFILGAFILAAAMTGTGLSLRIAHFLLLRFGGSPIKLAATVYLLAAGLSFCMSEHAVAAMLFPVVAQFAQSLDLKKLQSRYAKLLFMSIAWGCIIGGIATFLGGARAPLAVGMLKESAGIEISFLQWGVAAFMVVLPLLLIGFLLLHFFFRPDIKTVESGIITLKRKRLQTGRIRYNEIITAFIMVSTIFCWLFFGKSLGLGSIALSAVALLFVFRVVSWSDIEAYVNWGIIIMYGGAIAIASALEKTGAARWIAGKLLVHFGQAPFITVAVISLLAILLTECISNAAVIAILMPIGLSLASGMGMDPRVMTLSIALPAGLAYSLPMGTPATAIAYGSGYLTSRDIILPGIVIMTISWILFLFSVLFVWPRFGFRL